MNTSIITPKLIQELEQAFKHVNDYGSIEIYIQASQVTQITTRKIRKTKHNINGKLKSSNKTKNI